jgi:two-component system nitrogen regulation sensor histidine kinase GlnL
MLPRLFTPFATSKPHGTGLGLAISKRIVEAHGGRIEVKNRSGGGAEANLYLPLEMG